jgi:glyoxylase-like metal-dependent hydrolase (beta-lactamase superfamily II)
MIAEAASAEKQAQPLRLRPHTISQVIDMNNSASTSLCLAAAALSFAGSALAQQDFSAVEVKVHEVASNFYYLEGAGGNAGILVGDDGVVMVDDQFAPLSDKLVAAIRTVSSGPIRFLINTHIHGDHNGGNENFAAMGAAIMAHDNVRTRMVNAEMPRPPAGRPVITFGDTVSLHLNDQDINVVKVPPAHTDGDSIVHFPAIDVIHTGDVFRTTGYPGVDDGNGGTVGGTLEALQVIIDLAGPNTRIVPGHGVPASRAEVVEFRDMVAEVQNRISRLIQQGMTVEQVLAADATADLDERWGSFERFLPGFYAALKKEM